MRVYLPATAAELSALGTSPESLDGLNLAGRYAHGVTKRLAGGLPDMDQDELEWEAFVAATIDAAALLVADPAAPPMRVVLSLDVPDSAINETAANDLGQLSTVQLQPVKGGAVAAIHVEEPASSQLLQNLRANPDSASAQAAVLDADLLWYDPSELNEIPIPHV